MVVWCNIAEHENITKDGRIIYCEWNSAIIYDEYGKPVSVLSMAADITEKIEAEKQFKEIYINSDRALDLTKSGFWQIKMNDFRHFVASDRVREIFGLVRKSENDVPELAEVIKQIKVLNPEMADLIALKLEKIVKGELGHFEVEHEYQHPQSGEALWIKSKAYLDKDEKGNPVSLYGVSQDINPHQKASAGARKSPRSCRSCHQSQKRFSGQYEPRNSHAYERHHWHDSPGAKNTTR